MASAMPLRLITDIRRFFEENETPIFFINSSDYNMMGAQAWIGQFSFITVIDFYEGNLPQLFCLAPHMPGGDSAMTLEEINTRLLSHDEVRRFILSKAKAGVKSKVMFLMYDDTNEQLARALNLDICHPANKLKAFFDDKINTVRLAEQASVPSVPNVLSVVHDYAHLRAVAGHLGEHLVIQKAFGDSGRTTFFISNESDFDACSELRSTDGAELKIMKRINCHAAAMEGCATASGTIVGPLMSEVIGFRELTPLRGAWCGNELGPGIFDVSTQKKARQYTERIGDMMYKMGYKGYFELDFLIDQSDSTLYLGEINPRLSGASPLTNQSSFAQANAPLYLYHLLEWMDVDFELDVADLNKRWFEHMETETWSQMLVKHLGKNGAVVESVPRSGIWKMLENGTIEYARPAVLRSEIRSDEEALLLCVPKIGDSLKQGHELTRMLLRGRVMDESFELTTRSKTWIEAVRQTFTTKEA